MGAYDFTTTSLGKTAEQAFDRAVRDAQYEYGHGGYTGSIAEKHDFVLVATPKGTSAERLLAKTYDAHAALEAEAGTEWARKATAKERKALAYLREKLGHQADRWIEAAEGDKWGPAAAIEVTGKRAAEIKARAGRKGTHDKVFTFTGYASS
ncbi:MAG TPA: hypothetical protein VMW08_00225 [Acidimicrobiales bacterium]|nr:hypothetical protein [Acidimicrobiales bacterium]